MNLEPLKIAREIVDILADKKGENIVLMDIKDLTVIADYFVICSGTSFRMLRALADAVEEHLRGEFKIKVRVQGDPNTGWLIADYGGTILHIFSSEQRAFYDLDELWSEGNILVRMQ